MDLLSVTYLVLNVTLRVSYLVDLLSATYLADLLSDAYLALLA